jgi:hypothetical protein
MERDSSADGASRPPLSRRAAVCFFVVYLIVQVSLPVYRLWAPRPARFGWQMFSSSVYPVRVRLLRRDGSEEPLDPAAYVGNPRADLDYERFVPPHICKMRPDVAAVRFQLPGPAPLKEYQCPSATD